MAKSRWKWKYQSKRVCGDSYSNELWCDGVRKIVVSSMTGGWYWYTIGTIERRNTWKEPAADLETAKAEALKWLQENVLTLQQASERS